jgi:hypothetical protein
VSGLREAAACKRRNYQASTPLTQLASCASKLISEILASTLQLPNRFMQAAAMHQHA